MVKWMPAEKGYLKIKVQCPECGLMVAGKIDIREAKANIPCQCGRATLQILLTNGFEWEIERPAAGSNFFNLQDW
ncbi:hypothetical protein [Desulfotomaculum copahuensis]|uniref:hypothetical protein n=1 Tax=Desulfotomaculum copahuensis TaxID=1838280 RepID=UPI001245C724|nr:hypothetical protein [Desulfotomaculum copahuensis]